MSARHHVADAGRRPRKRPCILSRSFPAGRLWQRYQKRGPAARRSMITWLSLTSAGAGRVLSGRVGRRMRRRRRWWWSRYPTTPRKSTGSSAGKVSSPLSSSVAEHAAIAQVSPQVVVVDVACELHRQPSSWLQAVFYGRPMPARRQCRPRGAAAPSHDRAIQAGGARLACGHLTVRVPWTDPFAYHAVRGRPCAAAPRRAPWPSP